MELSNDDSQIPYYLGDNEFKDLEKNVEQLHLFTDTLIYLNEVLSDLNVQIPVWKKYSETLLLKFCLHAFTICNTAKGVKYESKYFDFKNKYLHLIDVSSTKTLLRAQLETFLMYCHIYVNPKTEDDIQLRYYSWIYGSLMQRTSFPATTENAKRQKENDEEEMEKIKNVIIKLDSFKKLTTKQQTSLLTTGNGKLFSHWSTILEESGFTRNHSIHLLYGFVSIFAHSEGLSAIQLDNTNFAYSSSKKDIVIDAYFSKTLVCLFITLVKDKFQEIALRYESLNSDLRVSIEYYSNLGKLPLRF